MANMLKFTFLNIMAGVNVKQAIPILKGNYFQSQEQGLLRNLSKLQQKQISRRLFTSEKVMSNPDQWMKKVHECFMQGFHKTVASMDTKPLTLKSINAYFSLYYTILMLQFTFIVK